MKLPNFPHEIDVYPARRIERAIVFLHGGGGNKSSFAKTLGMGQMWLDRHRVVALFPQGQKKSLFAARTWSNRIMDSGVDDVAFLSALATYIRATYRPMTLTLAGHSMGGAMTQRMSYDAPLSYSRYVSIAGPASVYYLSAPVRLSLVRFVQGDADEVIRPEPWLAETWTLAPIADYLNPVVVGEAKAQRGEVMRVSGADHSIESIEVYSGKRVRDLVVEF